MFRENRRRQLEGQPRVRIRALRTRGLALIVLLSTVPIPAFAQASPDDLDLDDLRRQLEELAKTVENQTNQLDQQALEIESLKEALAEADASKEPDQPSEGVPLAARASDIELEESPARDAGEAKGPQIALDAVAGQAPDALDEKRVGRYPD